MGLKYAVIGTGAIGGFYGGKLANTGKEVHFLFRGDYKQVKENGLQVNSVDGDFLLKQVNAYKSTCEMPVCDVVLVGLKTTANHLLPSLLKPILHKDSLVILIQNGLGIEERLAKELPGVNIAGGLAFICSQKNKPGVISHLDYGKITLGLYKGDKQQLGTVANDFAGAGIDVQIARDLGHARWQKLVWNVPFNGMSVVLGAATDEMLKNRDARQLLHDIMEEVVLAAQACGHALSNNLPDKMIATTLEMTPYAPSMKLDFDSKRPMEIETIYSAPIKTALEAGYEMKKTAMLEQQLRFCEWKAGKPEQES